MTTLLGARWNAAAAAIICVFATVAVAQRTLDTEQPQSSQTNRDASIESNEGQPGRASATQAERSAAQPANRAGQRYTANFRGESTLTGGVNQEVEKFLAGCLLINNQAEVDLSQLASQRAQNPQVKEFAQQMVKDHQQLIQQLQPLVSMQAGAAQRTGRTPLGATDDPNRVRVGDTSASDTADPSAISNAVERAADAATAAVDGQPPRVATNARNEIAAARDSSNAAIQQLAQIDRQISDRLTQAARSELEEKQGAEFDKAYIGCAIGAHMRMNAALEVIGQQGEGKLSQLAQQAQPKVQQHLDHAKQLMRELDQGASSTTGNRAARQPSETQRE